MIKQQYHREVEIKTVSKTQQCGIIIVMPGAQNQRDQTTASPRVIEIKTVDKMQQPRFSG